MPGMRYWLVGLSDIRNSSWYLFSGNIPCRLAHVTALLCVASMIGWRCIADSNSIWLEVELAVIVSYERSLFPGKITKIVSESHVRVSCMVPVAGGSKLLWKWPQHVDTNVYPNGDVRM